MRGWEVFERSFGAEVIPVDDSGDHLEMDELCPCAPRTIYESGRRILIHNAYDGRQEVEWANHILGEHDG